MQFVPDPHDPGLATLVDDGTVPPSMIWKWDPTRIGLPASTPAPASGPPGNGWFKLLYLQQDEALMISGLQSQAQAQQKEAQLAAFRAGSVGLYDVTFACEITAGDDLSLVSWTWTATWQNGGREFAPQGLVPNDGSSIESAGYVNGVFVVKSTPPRWQKWGGIGPGSTWVEELRLTFTNPNTAGASIACVGCSAGSIVRSIDSSPRFGLRSQALDG